MMSDVVEKTLSALPSMISSGLGVTTERDWGHSRGFQAFVKHINNLKNKHEEDVALEKELTLQKQKLAQSTLSPVQKRESLVRIIYCHMLGKDVSFACIHALKLAGQGSVYEKKVGYLVCSLLMNKNDDILILLCCTMQKDLSSTNVLYNLAGLTAVVHLCSTHTIPFMLPLVKDKLNHPKDAVRKKAVLAIHEFLQQAPDLVLQDMSVLQRTLSDRDPSVVWSTLHVYALLIPKDPRSYQYLVPGLVSLLGQVIGRKLPSDYDYHTVPAPWITLLLLRLLSKLGAHDESASQQIYPALRDVLQRTESSHKMGLAVIFECLQTITQIYPYPQLVDQAVSCVGKFLSAKSINLKYLGLKALVSMASISPQCTVEHQEIVLDCLEHPDPTIQRKTIELLYKMAGPANVKVISDKMLEFMTLTSDQVIKADIIHKVIDLTQRFSSKLPFYLETMNQVITVAEKFLPDDTVDTVLWKIAQGCACSGDESDPLSNKQLRSDVFKIYWKLLVQPALPETLIQIAIWVLGEYNHSVQGVTPKQVMTALLHWYTKTCSDKTRCQVTAALQKMSYYITDHTAVLAVLRYHQLDIASNYCYELKQRIQELEQLCKSSKDMKIAANPETRTDIKELDLTLSFLDEFVCKALERGAAPYKPQSAPQHTQPDLSTVPVTSLQFAPYDAPQVSRPNHSLVWETNKSASSGSTRSSRESGLKLVSSKKKVWGRDGIIKEETKSDIPVADVSQGDEVAPQSERQVREMTPEQVKRKELAYAIFGDIKQKTLPAQDENLVNLSTSEAVPSSPAADPPQLFHTPPSALSPELPTETSPSIEAISNPDSGLTTPDTKHSLAQLLNYDSLTSPEDQVITESLYHSFKMEQNLDLTEEIDSTLRSADNLDKTSETLTQPLSMYDECTISSLSSSSDDFVHHITTEESSRTIADKNDIFNALKDKQPSPWKLLGPRKLSHNYEDSIDDSISIEVDSIEEDEPPSEFIVESNNKCNTRQFASEIGFPKGSMLEDLEDLPMCTEQVLYDNDVYICGCQKIYKADCLVLMLYFNHKSPQNDNGGGDQNIASLLIDQQHYQIRCQKLSDSEEHMSTEMTGEKLDVSVPSVVALCTKAVQSPPLPPLCITLTLPDSTTPHKLSVSMQPTDFFRPLAMDVEEFGQSWTAEDTTFKRTSIPISQGEGHNRGHNKVIQDMGFQLIQEIGSEVIFATQWLGLSPDVLLLHSKAANSAVQVSVKGHQAQLVSQVVGCIQQLLTSQQS